MAKKPPVTASDPIPKTPPVPPAPSGTRVLVQETDDVLTEHYVSEPDHTFLVRIGEYTYHHCADAPDGTWIYKR